MSFLLPLLTDRHRRARMIWCMVRHNWNFRTWSMIHWSDESLFFTYMTQDKSTQTEKHSLFTTKRLSKCSLWRSFSYGLRCISHEWNVNLITIRDNLYKDQYIRDLLRQVVVSHFDNQPEQFCVYGWKPQTSSFKSSNCISANGSFYVNFCI